MTIEMNDNRKFLNAVEPIFSEKFAQLGKVIFPGR